MAVKIGFVIILSLLLRASLSLPISLEVKVQLIESVPESGLAKSKVSNLEKNLSLEEDNKLVQSLSTETLLKAFEDHGKRIKRNNIKPWVLCPGDTFQYGTQCLTRKEYEDNGLEGSDDYEAER